MKDDSKERVETELKRLRENCKRLTEANDTLSARIKKMLWVDKHNGINQHRRVDDK